MLDDAIEIVNQVAEEYGDGWILCRDRMPSKEECGIIEEQYFQVTARRYGGKFFTTAMRCEYTDFPSGIEHPVWKWRGRLSAWDVIAWKPLDAPYQPKGE